MACRFGHTGQHAAFALVSTVGVVWFCRVSARHGISGTMRALVCGSILVTCIYHLLVGTACAFPSVAHTLQRTIRFEEIPQQKIRLIFHHQPKALLHCLIGTILLSRRRSHTIIAAMHGFVLLHTANVYWRYTHEGIQEGLPVLGVTYVLASLACYLSIYLSTRAKPLANCLFVAYYRQFAFSAMNTWMDALDLESRSNLVHPHWVAVVDIATQDTVNTFLMFAVAHAVILSHPTGRMPFATQLSRPSVSHFEWIGLSAVVVFLAVCYQSPTLRLTFPFARLSHSLMDDVNQSHQRDLLGMDMDRANNGSVWLGQCVTAALILSLFGTVVAARARATKRRNDEEGNAACTSVRLNSESVAINGPSKTGLVLSWLRSIAQFNGIGASEAASPDPLPEASLSGQATSDQGQLAPSPFTSEQQRQQTSNSWATYIEQQRLGSLQRPAKLAKVQVVEQMTAASFAASLGQSKTKQNSRNSGRTPAKCRAAEFGQNKFGVNTAHCCEQ